LGFEPYQLQNVAEGHAFPVIVEAAPARHAVKIASDPGLRKAVELIPGQTRGSLYAAEHAKIPGRRLEARNRTVMQDRPFQRKCLAGRQAAFLQHLLL